MNASIHDLMVPQVMTATASQTVQHIRDVMREHNVHALPVVDAEHQPVGIVSATDLLNGAADGAPVSSIMSRKVYTVPQYSGPHIAARMMRNHHIHHLVVTHEQKVVGILSSYDLLRLVEDHRFVMKNAPSDSKKKGARGKVEFS